MKNIEIRFIFQKEATSLLDSFSRLLDIRTSFLAPDGRELFVGRRQEFCTFCKLIRSKLDLEEQCLACDRKNWKAAERTGKPVIYKCHGGMMDGCVPVTVHGQTLGYIMMGQFRTSDVCVRSARAKWKKLFGDDALNTAFLSAPLFPPAKVKDILAMFTALTEFIVRQHLIGLEGFNPIQPLLTYMEQHPSELLSVGDAARLLHRSASSVAHLFKKVAGKSLLQHQIALKLDLADKLFAKRAGTTVSAVAADLGFSDPYYFSRLYKKHRGHPPSRAMKSSVSRRVPAMRGRVRTTE